MNVNDKISSPNATTLVRKIQITGAPESLYFQLASATQIELISKGLYAIGNKNYYNTGDFCESCSFLYEDYEGNIKLTMVD